MAFFVIEEGPGSIVGTAIHDGHLVRDGLLEHMAISEEDRLREEDPETAVWANIVDTTVIGRHTRFQVDLNRPRDKAVYRFPEDAWGLRVWRDTLADKWVEAALKEYDTFYATIERLYSSKARQHGRFVVLDFHSYNHRRLGSDAPEAPAGDNPQINVGTGTMNRDRWGSLIDRFIADLHAYPFPGGALDVRENVRFRGGNHPRWVHEKFPNTGCAIAIEVKKFFMDEWTGVIDTDQLYAVKDALASTIPGILEELSVMK